MQNQGSAFQTLGREKACQSHPISRFCPRHQLRGGTQGHGRDFTRHLALAACLDLFRLVCNEETYYRHARRGVAQRRNFKQAAGQVGEIAGDRDSGLRIQAAAPADASDGADVDSERDFSSFIIGEGSVAACFIFTVR